MPILATSSITAIDTSAILKGDLIRAKYHTWDNAVNGIVAGVTSKAITVLYIGTGGNVSNYFIILAEELEDELWEVTWSTDMDTVYHHPVPQPENDPETVGGEET